MHYMIYHRTKRLTLACEAVDNAGCLIKLASFIPYYVRTELHNHHTIVDCYCSREAGGQRPIDRPPVTASPSHPNKDGRATDSCFTLVGAHQYGILMDFGCFVCSHACTLAFTCCVHLPSITNQQLVPVCKLVYHLSLASSTITTHAVLPTSFPLQAVPCHALPSASTAGRGRVPGVCGGPHSPASRHRGSAPGAVFGCAEHEDVQ